MRREYLSGGVFGHRNSLEEDVAVLDNGDVVFAIAKAGLGR
jgi:hypothetical protein